MNKVKFLHFDDIHLLVKENENTEVSKHTTLWNGTKGTYTFLKVDQTEKPSKMIYRVMLNRKYFSGLFKTKLQGYLNADYREGETKHYLTFKKLSNDHISIYEKIQVS